MFSETCLKYKLHRSLLQPFPILEPSPKTFQSNRWLRIAQSEQQNFIKQDQDQHTMSTPEGRAALPPPKTTCGPQSSSTSTPTSSATTCQWPTQGLHGHVGHLTTSRTSSPRLLALQVRLCSFTEFSYCSHSRQVQTAWLPCFIPTLVISLGRVNKRGNTIFLDFKKVHTFKCKIYMYRN
jgi:hypothetical protein